LSLIRFADAPANNGLIETRTSDRAFEEPKAPVYCGWEAVYDAEGRYNCGGVQTDSRQVCGEPLRGWSEELGVGGDAVVLLLRR